MAPARMVATRARMVRVLPVPGGPCNREKLPCIPTLVAVPEDENIEVVWFSLWQILRIARS